MVAAENVWGSIATQLGGDRVSVKSLIRSPDADPHEYEPRASDARAVASADYVIVNGAGYDPWAAKLIAAGGPPGRLTLDVADLVGVGKGGNPHRWYSPADVERVIARMTADYQRLAPLDAGVFDRQRAAFEEVALGAYHRAVAGIQQRFGGTPVGASESIFVPMADALGLTVLTPEPFLDAISEGTDPTPGDKATADRQIRSRRVKVYVFNSQNATPDVRAQVKLAESVGTPVVAVTETIVPGGATFQDWQSAQLQRLADALATAAGT